MRSVLLFPFLAFYFVSYSQIIDFPDANFKYALVNIKCVDTNNDRIGDKVADLNNDGEIDISEALKVKRLIVGGHQISNLSGIENFYNLVFLDCDANLLENLSLNSLINLSTIHCSGNGLKNLDFSGLINLQELYCNNSQITDLNLDGLSNLNIIYCKSNQLTELNLKDLKKLKIIDCSNNKISFLELDSLKELTELNCSGNQIQDLNLNSLNNLIKLSCSRNLLKTLNTDKLLKLTGLYCGENKLETLDVSHLVNLNGLGCYENQISELDLSTLTNLSSLSCNNNQLKTLDLSQQSKLFSLSFSYNQIKSINLENLTNLHELFCSNNKLEVLDISNNLKLNYIICYENPIRFLFLKTGKKISNLYINFNSNMNYICCNESEVSSFESKVRLAGLTNCEVNSYCSFTPGGKFYLLNGVNKYDTNNNGCDDQDIKVPNIKYNITNGSIAGCITSNSTGNYSIPVQAGTHKISPILDHPDYFEVTPTSYSVTFPASSDTITQDFCITPKGIFSQTNITVIPLSPPARPGFDAKYKIVWENVGNQIESGTLNFTYDETLLDYISASQAANLVADGIIKWNFTNLLPFEKREIIVTLKVNRPTDTPAVNAGDKLYLTASILDNIFTLENTVVGSYDPNDKTCLQGDRVKPDMVGEYVDYLIRFENTGNYAAENVVVKDIIDTKTFDVSTLKITDASHEVYTRIEGNKVEFIFENIQLPFDDANNDGYIAFKIKTLPTLVLGDSLKNLADIYFDYNFPIRTNEAQTTVAFPVFTTDITTEVKIYPNPVNEILYLDTNENWTIADIYDISGKIMRSISLNGQSMDVSGLESGTYFIRLRDGDSVGLVKFLKI